MGKTLIFGLIILGNSLPVVGQCGKQKLGDIAGSIKLTAPDENTAATISDAGITSHDELDRNYDQCVTTELQRFRKAAGNLRALVSDGPTVASSLWYDDFMRKRDTVIRVSNGFSRCHPTEAWRHQRFQRFLEVVRDFTQVLRSLDNPQWGTAAEMRPFATSGPKFRLAVYAATQLDQLNHRFENAAAELGISDTPEALSPGSNRPRRYESIERLCSQRFPDRDHSFETCTAIQEAALIRLENRDSDLR